MKPREYVEWFHSKFRSTYRLEAYPTIKEDHEVLIACIEQFDCRTVLEIGTWLGDTGLLLWLHPRVKSFKAIDIHKDMGVVFDQHQHQLMPKEEYGRMYKNTYAQLIFVDSMTYPRGQEQHDLIFIDGAHDYEHVKNDTELAISFNPKIIVWHDYGGGNDDVVKYINELMENGSQILRFHNSLCVAAQPENIKI